jgi:hypothetical protein
LSRKYLNNNELYVRQGARICLFGNQPASLHVFSPSSGFILFISISSSSS